MSKTLSILQPWASGIALGFKRIETRSWTTNYRGPLLIHASKNDSKDSRFAFLQEYLISKAFRSKNIYGLRSLPHGAIIAKCNLVDCVLITEEFIKTLSEQELAFGDYTLGRYAWKLIDVIPFKEPILAKGQLGIWNYKG